MTRSFACPIFSFPKLITFPAVSRNCFFFSDRKSPIELLRTFILSPSLFLMSVANLKENIGEKINVLKNSIGDFLSEKKKQFLKTAGNVLNFGKKKIGETVGNVKDLVGDAKKTVAQGTKFLASSTEKLKNVASSGVKIGKEFLTDPAAVVGDVGEFIQDKKEKVIEGVKEGKKVIGEKLGDAKDVVVEKMKEGRKNIFGGFQKLADRVTGNVFDLDKSGEGITGPLRVVTGLADQALNAIGVESDLDRRGTDTGGSLNKPIVQADAPFQSGASLIPTASPISFVKTIDNSQLSISKHGNVPREIARLI